MKIKVINSYENAAQATGLTVVVDVLRAFTTCCYIFQNGAKNIITVSDVEEARELISKNPHYISVGERQGLKITGFDYGNSPAEIKNINMQGKTIVITTSAGTQGIAKSEGSDEIITGAFVNAQAIVSYIEKQQPNMLSFIITNDRYKGNEDFMFVEYVRRCLNKERVNFDKIKKQLMNHPSSEGFLRKPLTKYSRPDFNLSISLDKFNFVIKAVKKKDSIYLEREYV